IPGAAAARSRINGCVTLQDFDQVFDAVLAHLAATDATPLAPAPGPATPGSVPDFPFPKGV
ncbi:MAG: hypothetical protein RSD38_04555, partial [Raoultibacter sp.]